MSIPTSSRLLALLSLLQQRREWSGPELAGELGVGPRTIRRDVDKLRGLGYPVGAAPGTAGGYRLGAGAKLPPLLVDDAEAVAIAVGLRSAASGAVSGTEETALRALAKIEQVMPERLRRRVSALAEATSAVSFHAPRVDADLLADLAGACRDHAVVRIGYTKPEEERATRTVEPSALVHSVSRWFLVAWDVDREDWRTFRVDRISGTMTSVGRGTRRTVPGGDPAQFVSQRHHGPRSVEPALPALIRVHAPAAEVSDRVPLQLVSVEPDGAGRCLVRSKGPWTQQLLVWMALLAREIDVLEPPELIEEARAVAARLAAATTTRLS